MLTDEWLIEVMAARAEEECGFSKLSTVLNHYSWVDVMTHLFLEKGLRGPLLDAYKDEIIAARVKEHLAARESYPEWKADVATRGGC